MKTLESFLNSTANVFSFIPKILDVSLKVFLFPWYLSGKGMFRRIKSNVYQPTRLFLGTPGPVQKQGTVWNIPWLFKPIEENGKIVEVSRQPLDYDFNLDYATKDGLSGQFKKCQFTYLIPSKGDARQYYWTGSGDIGRVEDMIFSYVTEEIGKREGKDLIGNLSEVSNNVLSRLIEEKQKYIRKTYGIEIKRISLGSPDWSDKAEEILSIAFKEQQEADARIIRAQSQRKEAEIQAEATRNMAKMYLEAAEIYRSAGSILSVGDIALKLYEGDNIESIAGKPNINAVFYSPSNPGNNMIIPFPIKNKDYQQDVTPEQF